MRDQYGKGKEAGGRSRIAINRQIRAPEVRLITADGQQVGVVRLEDALEQAENSGLDLVEVSPQTNPPVCKIMDFGKYLFEQRKKVRNRAKQVQVKELKLRPAIDVGDYLVKIKRATEFLQNGDKVRFVVRFRGRELSYQQHGRDILVRIAEDLKEHGAVEQSTKVEGKQMTMVVAPSKKK